WASRAWTALSSPRRSRRASTLAGSPHGPLSTPPPCRRPPPLSRPRRGAVSAAPRPGRGARPTGESVHKLLWPPTAPVPLRRALRLPAPQDGYLLGMDVAPDPAATDPGSRPAPPGPLQTRASVARALRESRELRRRLA